MNNDLISREALKDAIYERPESEGNARAAQLLEAIIKAPAVDAEPVRHGRWRQKVDGLWWPNDVTCSECAAEYSFYKPSKYCPDCGAKMDGGNDE